MKKMLSVAALCFICSFAKAQITDFNMTCSIHGTCDIYIEVYGSSTGCAGTDMAVLIVPAGFPPTHFPIASLAWPGTPPNYIDYIRVYEADPNFCPGAASIELGESCMSKPITGSLSRYDNTCNTCGPGGTHTMDWNNGSSGYVMVELN